MGAGQQSLTQEVGTYDSDMTGAKKIQILDVVFQPHAADKESVMDNDMVCLITAGEFKIKKADKNSPSKKVSIILAGRARQTTPRT